MPPLRAGRDTGSLPLHRPIATIGRWLAALLVLTAPSSLAAQTAAGTSLTSIVSVSFEVGGEEYTVFADPADGRGEDFVVGREAGVVVDSAAAASADPGATVTFRHLLRNSGNAADTFTVTAASRHGWAVKLQRDGNGNGALDAADPVVTGPIPLDPQGEVAIWVSVSVPAGSAAQGVQDSVHVTARSDFDPAASDSAVDRIMIHSPGIAVALQKAVDRATATTGDTLTYTITYAVTGAGIATGFRITDAVPAGTTYVPGSLHLNGTALTDAGDSDAGTFDVAGNRIIVALASVAGGDSGSVTFRVRVAP